MTSVDPRSLGSGTLRDDAATFVDSPRLEEVSDRDRYDVLREIARGGNGRVMLAYDRRLHRMVAVKELLSRDPALEARFVREALLTARLAHPSIVSVFEAGRWPDGRPFLAMKLVTGRSLDTAIDATKTLADRLALVRNVLAAADAMAYAHAQRIVHRDLKPANVLVGDFGETVVIDWGLGKDLSTPGDAAAIVGERSISAPAIAMPKLTLDGRVMGTPAYMPPEQARGLPVDERADVFALGAMLYQLLGGAPPYLEPTLAATMNKVASGLREPLAKRAPDAPHDLVAIVEKAMNNDATNRYPTARELAEDLRKLLNGQMVNAHRYSLGDRALRLLARYRAAAIVAFIALLLLLVGGSIGARDVLAARDDARRRQSEAEAANRAATQRNDALVMMQARTALDDDPNLSLAWLKTLSPERIRSPEARLIAGDARGRGISRVLRGHRAGINRVELSPDGRYLVTTSDDHAARLWTLATGTSRVLEGHTDEVWGATFSSDGRTLVTTSKDRTLRVWDVERGTSRALEGLDGAALHAKLSHDGRTIASRGKHEPLRVWSVETGRARVVAAATGDVDFAFSDDDHTLAYAEKGSVFLYDLERGTKKKLRGAQDKPTTAVALTADGSRVVTGSVDGIVRVFGPRGLVELRGHEGAINALSIDAQGGRAVTASEDGTLRVWDLASGKSTTLRGHEGPVLSARWSRDGSAIVSAGFDHSVRVWDPRVAASSVLHGFQDVASSAVFTPDGLSIAAASYDRTARVWDLADRGGRLVTRHEGACTSAHFFGDAAHVITSGVDGSVRFVTLSGAHDANVIAVRGHEGRVLDTATSPRGDVLASAGADSTVRLYRPGSAAFRVLQGHTGPVLRVAFSPDGDTLASAGQDGTVWLWSATTGQGTKVASRTGEATALAFSSDGKQLAAGGASKVVTLIDVAQRTSRDLAGHTGQTRALAFSPDGHELASGGNDHTIRLWDLASLSSGVIDASGGGVIALAFGARGETLFSIGGEPAIRTWDARSLAERFELSGHVGNATALALSPDGAALATGGEDRAVRLWDPSILQSRVMGTHPGAVRGIEFSLDGHAALSRGEDGSVFIWDDAIPSEESSFRAWLDAATPEEIAR